MRVSRFSPSHGPVTASRAAGLPLRLAIGTPENDAGVTYRVQDLLVE